MTEKVVSLRGTPIADREEADEEAVNVLKRTLELVENGEVGSVAVGFTYRDGTYGFQLGGQDAESTHMLGVLSRMISYINAELDDDT